eukprot:406682-Pyramimonas_sp.AAC.1
MARRRLPGLGSTVLVSAHLVVLVVGFFLGGGECFRALSATRARAATMLSASALAVCHSSDAC